MAKPRVTVRIEIPADGEGHEDAMAAIAEGLQYLRAAGEYEKQSSSGYGSYPDTLFQLTVRYDDGRLPYSTLQDALDQVAEARHDPTT